MHFLQRIGEYKLYLYINISIYLHYGRSSSQNVTIAPNNLFFGTLVWLSANCDNTAFLFKTNTVWSNTKFFCNFRYAFFFLFSVFYNAFKNNFCSVWTAINFREEVWNRKERTGASHAMLHQKRKLRNLFVWTSLSKLNDQIAK